MGCSVSVLPQDTELNNNVSKLLMPPSSTAVAVKHNLLHCDISNDASCSRSVSISERSSDVSNFIKDELDTFLQETSTDVCGSYCKIVADKELNEKTDGKSIAYEIKILDGDKLVAKVDNILKRPLPNRLKHLEPLPNRPILTRDKLTRKLKTAEEKRKQMLELKRFPYPRQRSFLLQNDNNSRNMEDSYSESGVSSKNSGTEDHCEQSRYTNTLNGKANQLCQHRQQHHQL